MIKKSSVAGVFYPSSAEEILYLLNQYFVKIEAEESKNIDADVFNVPKAIIVPHAGYIFSGKTAGSIYSIIENYKNEYKTIVLLGPAHREYTQKIAIHSAGFFETPLGVLPINATLREELLQFSFVETKNSVFSEEHSIEVQLPFLQKIFSSIKILPMLVSDTDYRTISTLFDKIDKLKDTLIVISSDLSHFLDHISAEKKDKETISNILSGQYEKIQSDDACGSIIIQAYLYFLENKKKKNQSVENIKTTLIDYSHSGETSKDNTRVVGYTSIIFS